MMQYLKERPRIGLFIVVLFHVSGILGILSPMSDVFIAMTPLNMLVTIWIAMAYEETLGKKFLTTMTIIMIAGYLLEVLGVNTGIPFGTYKYGPPFGIQLWDTPLLIGLNWWIMTYGGYLVTQRLTKSKLANSIAAGIIITAVDFIIEPVAIALNYWTWDHESVPVQNYIAWVLASALFVYVINWRHDTRTNPIMVYIFIIQFIFFSVLNMLL